ncbi:MAG: DNA polymerase III subunit alpha [Treponema sp.]|nr:DNA polymerase III subunit alpha [Treponema sp.]
MSEIKVFPNPAQGISVSNFVHLHVHSDFSMNDGSSNIYSLVSKAKSMNMKYLALTDINNLIATPDFVALCRANNISPIIGMEVVVSDDGDFYNLVLLCKDISGYKNLCQITGCIFSKKYTARKHFVTIEELRDFKAGLICLTGGRNGALYSLMAEDKMQEAENRAVALRKIFGNDFYVELQNHGSEKDRIVGERMSFFAKRLHMICVLTNEVNYCSRGDAEANEILRCIRKNEAYQAREDLNREWYLKNESEMYGLFPYASEALKNTMTVATKCSYTIPHYSTEDCKNFLPQIVPPKQFCIHGSNDENQQELLTRLVSAGLKSKYKIIPEDVQKRSDQEISYIVKHRLTNFFLMIWEYVNWASDQDINVSGGIGATPCSLVAFALGLTDVDPLKNSLPVERLMNEESTGFPETGVEFGADKINRLIQHLKILYGEKKVANIIDVKYYRGSNIKKLFIDLGCALRIPDSDVKMICDKVPDGDFTRLRNAFLDPDEFHPENGQLVQFKNDPRFSRLFKFAFKLEGSVSNFSIHSSGVVISNSDLCKMIPVCSDPKTEELLTQYTAEHLRNCGLHRFDLFDSPVESFLRRCEDLILKNHPGDHFLLDKISPYDPETFALFTKGHTDEIIGFESEQEKGLLESLAPSSFDELMAFYTLDKQGRFYQIQDFISRKENPSLIQYPNQCLKPVLQETYGLLLYQEQMMLAVREISGLSLEKADAIRRCIAESNNTRLEELKKNFTDGAKEKGFSEGEAEKLYNRIAPTASFAFLKANAVVQTKKIYTLAWLKVHYNHEYETIKKTYTLRHWWTDYSMVF